MYARRIWLKVALATIVGFVSARVSHAQQGRGSNGAERQSNSHAASLEDQLHYGLRAVTPAQLKFVKTVVQYVDEGRIPRAMVNMVFTWARERNPRVPFPYFEFAMRELTKRRGTTLP
ncbi:hypothetical protein [Aureliella helgolandensis]|uniref:Uncharacterized protein n=1 Tax=Aureliella helgolandensis TaxID=2527968 RepID=A0A518G2Y8_9BACT|nr:hypothetical protein [Aureliella helgolandensis]QDV22963.1 hypothetical protein Q31a_12560 [Aureliella helgolandensis]